MGCRKTLESAVLVLHHAQVQIAGDADVERACRVAEDVGIAAGHGRMLAVLWFRLEDDRRYQRTNFCG
jgi:hypothetical protein